MNVNLSGLKLSGISATYPPNELSLDYFYDSFGERETNRILRSTGIKSVRVASADLMTSSLCIDSANKIIEKLGIHKKEIDAVIFVSQTPDYRMPATSCILQDRLGISKASMAFDINYGCSGYVYGLFQASLLVSAGSCSTVLLCTGDTISKHLDPNDRASRMVFGDGAASTIIQKGKDDWTFSFMTDGSGFGDLIIDKDCSRNDKYLKMDGISIMGFALSEVPAIVREVLQQKRWRSDDVDSFLFHQANAFILNYLRKKMNLPKSKVPIHVEQYGNTGPASIPFAACEENMKVSFSNMNKVVMCGFGVGLSCAAVALNLEDSVLLNISKYKEGSYD